MNTFFEAKLDTVSKIITSLLLPIFTIFPFYLYFVLNNAKDHSFLNWYVAIAIFLIAISVYLYSYWVQGYQLENGKIIINHKHLKDTIIAMDTIKTVTIYTKKEMGLLLRYWGNGGLFGYTGFFVNKTLGRMQWYGTQMQEAVFLQLASGKTIVVTPLDASGFVKALGVKNKKA